ncbi:hypothetical protein E4U58_001672 [Claviceps cyperi]|nr:hypothetical protein E4U58_001672 [Claviceps cyperi]
MELFYDGLREDVKDEIAKDEIAKDDRPDTFDDFVSKVVKVDNRLDARRLERGGRDTGFRGPPRGRTQPNTSQRRGGSTAHGTHSGPTELDAASRENPKTRYSCGLPGHFANKCRAPKKVWRPVAEDRRLNAAIRSNLPTRTVSMASSEESTKKIVGNDDRRCA